MMDKKVSKMTKEDVAEFISEAFFNHDNAVQDIKLFKTLKTHRAIGSDVELELEDGRTIKIDISIVGIARR